MDIYKDYIQKMRRLSFNEVYILIGEDLTPTLKQFIKLLTLVKFEPNSYFLLYNEFKKIISSFLVFHLKITDAIVKEADRCAHVLDKEDLLRLVEETISTHHANQITFGKEFLPVTNAKEKRIYEKIESEFNCFMEKMYEFKERIMKFDKKEVVDAFTARHFERACENADKMLNFTNIFIAMFLADRLEDIRVSINEIARRMSVNLRHRHEKFQRSLNTLLQKLYDKNKEGLVQSRCEKKSSLQTAEVVHGIKMVRNKIEQYEAQSATMQRHENEVAYWNRRMQQFSKIRDNLVKLKAEQDNIIEQEKIYNSFECFDPPGGSKRQAWVNMGLNYAERKQKLKEMIIRESRALITFFAVRGYDRILYKDNKGYYYVDELKHQIYVSNFALTLRHVNCEGELVKVMEKPYYFDKYGRYIIENDEKIYQVAPCSSQYKLGEDKLFKKITKDCGHADVPNKNCHMTIKNADVSEILPDFLPMDIKESLDAETVKYLWDSFGSLLPDALYDVCMKKPRNPIHMLAHRLIHHKYSRTQKELEEKKKKAEQYRLDIYKKRHEKEVEASVAWKSKVMKRHKPEESDDFEEAVFNAQQAERDFITYLNYIENEL